MSLNNKIPAQVISCEFEKCIRTSFLKNIFWRLRRKRERGSNISSSPFQILKEEEVLLKYFHYCIVDRHREKLFMSKI